MKTNKLMAALMILAVCFTAGNSFAQTNSAPPAGKSCCSMKDCCLMKDGKMMMMKDGKMMPMDKDMTMKDGTKCTTDGQCIMKDGTKMKMKDGQCMDMDGKMTKCEMGKDAKCCEGDKHGKHGKHNDHDKAANYSCPMHSDVVSDKPGKCPKCGMDLSKKK